MQRCEHSGIEFPVKSEWIKITDQRPPEKERFLFLCNDTQYVAWRSGKYYEYSECCGCTLDEPTHWMPLPEPPKAQ